MKIDFRLVDDKAVELVIVDEREDREKLLESVAFAILEFVFLVAAMDALKFRL